MVQKLNKLTTDCSKKKQFLFRHFCLLEPGSFSIDCTLVFWRLQTVEFIYLKKTTDTTTWRPLELEPSSYQ